MGGFICLITGILLHTFEVFLQIKKYGKDNVMLCVLPKMLFVFFSSFLHHINVWHKQEKELKRKCC